MPTFICELFVNTCKSGVLDRAGFLCYTEDKVYIMRKMGMQKEVLTLADCRERLLEANRVTSSVVWGYILVWLFLSAITSGFFTLIFGIVLSLISGKIPVFLYVITVAICAFPAVTLGVVLLRSFHKQKKLYQNIVRRDIEIVEDTLLRAYEDGEMRGGGKNRHYELFYILDFRNHGKYRVPEHQHYSWSELYSMSHRGIYNTSIAGTPFTLCD